MVTVKFINENISVEVEEGTKLAECIRKANLNFETPCNCLGICGKCKVRVKGDLYPPTLEEKKFINENDDIRLACLARVKGYVEIELLTSKSNLKTINRGYSIDIDVESKIKKVALPRQERTDQLPYSELIGYQIDAVNVYEKIAAFKNINEKNIYGIVCKEKLLDIGETFEQLLGVAIDIGTTGISAYLVDLETGEVINKVSCLNPQTKFGGDVLSRVSFCIDNENGAKILKETIINKVNEIISELLGEEFSANNMFNLVIAGNTIMLHLFLGINPASIAKAPYRPVFLENINISSRELGIKMHRNGIVTLLPSASGYVGADILAGILATGFNNKKHSAIFIDIGTNGEIVAISHGKMAATSTAAGPALEGMNISCGCRAEEGAIDSFKINETLDISFSTIGGGEPKGICGSGLIDIAASLVEHNIILASGKFNPDLDEKFSERLKNKKFYITEDIFISQTDIRQIQLAKGAIATGVNMLLKQIDISIEEVEEAVIAGAFGYHINPQSIMRIGIVPKGFTGKITFVGNSSIEGARLALLNEEALINMVNFKNEINVLELSTSDEFQQYFVKELKF